MLSLVSSRKRVPCRRKMAGRFRVYSVNPDFGLEYLGSVILRHGTSQEQLSRMLESLGLYVARGMDQVDVITDGEFATVVISDAAGEVLAQLVEAPRESRRSPWREVES